MSDSHAHQIKNRHRISDRPTLTKAQSLKKHYRSALFDDFVPWWEEHSIDRDCGGFFTRLEREGQPYAYDKDMWMTGRQIWMFSHLYNNYQKIERWRQIARHGLDFMLHHAFLDDGKMYFRLTREGQPMSRVLSIYTEVFAAIAVAEYGYIEDDPKIKTLALTLYERLVPRLGQPADTPLLGYPINAEFHLHAHDMCRLTVAWVFNHLWPDQKFEADILLSCDSILHKHWKPEQGVLLENVAMDGSPRLDLPEGRMFHPGHAIESAWMLMEVGLKRKDDKLVNTAIDIVIASLEHGWDQEYGGIRYITNIDWTPCHNLEADLKLWWPHGEALYALLLGWTYSGRGDLGDWYDKVHDYTFTHFPDPEFGEWFGYLNRDGSRVWTAKANGWKGFFHAPRVLFRCYQLLNEFCTTHATRT